MARAVTPYVDISIHAPREGSDPVLTLDRIAAHLISIHAPREGSDKGRLRRGESLGISIHAPREGSDQPSQLLTVGP